MLRFRAPSFTAAFTNLGRASLAITTFRAIDGDSHSVDDVEADRAILNSALREVQQALNELPVSRVISHQFRRLVEATARNPLDVREVQILIREFNNNLTVELADAWFLMIPIEHRELYEQRQPPFGEEVSNKFPEAVPDIQSACRCFALDEWTASVFHLMRALEYPLRLMASKFGVPFANDSWHAVIKGIEDGITALRNKPNRTDLDRAEIDFYSGAAVEFRHFKDAWRNHTMHAKVAYDQEQANAIRIHVRDFMRKVVNHP